MTMRFSFRARSLVALGVCAVATFAHPAFADHYKVTPLISDGNPGSVAAPNTNPNLINPWGISFGPTTAFWVSDNGTGVSTLNTGSGSAVNLTVKIPTPNGAPAGSVATPTGQVFVGGQGFTSSTFVFVTEDGTISSWTGSNGSNAVLRVDNSANSIYKGVASGQSGANSFLYAANFGTGKIDVFDTSYNAAALAGNFTDPNLPTGYSPFNVQNLGGKLYVTYAKSAGGVDETDGTGLGLVDVFNTDGTFNKRLASGSAVAAGGVQALNAPWGLALAPTTGFGAFSGDVLVGNFGNGEITAFDATTGAFAGTLTGADGNAIRLDGLWGLTFGNGAAAGDLNTLYYTAGPADETHGVFGSIAVVPEAGTGALMMPLVGIGAVVVARRRRRAA